MNELQPGLVLSERYKLDERIGRGGMAEVWLGEDRTLGRKVAIKIMLPQFAADPEFMRRFKREAAASAHLQSPYIVNIYDWGQDGSYQYIVMEYVQGEDLKDIIAAHGAIASKKAAKIGVQVCKALATAHQQDIIHRDVKPQNIMVQPDGNIKVMDFGIARAKNSTDQKTQVVLGTAHYVSPEQAQGLDLTAASDIYSLGIVLYEIVTGQLPFDGNDAVSVAMKQCNEQPTPPSYIIPNIDSQFEEIILRALNKDPNGRFASAVEMEQALEDYINGRRTFSDSTTRVIPTPAVVAPGTDPTLLMPRADGSVASAADATAGTDASGKMDPKKKRNIIIASVVGGIAVIAAIIALVFTLGAPVSVPDVIGQTVEEAQSTLEEAELSLGEVTEIPSADIEKGHVVSSDPSANSEVAKGSQINLKVSSGPQQVDVPDITGMTEEEALKALEDAGLRGVRSGVEASTDVEENCIISQTPKGNTKADAGSVISYIVSAGIEDVEVPDLTNMTEEDAMKALEAEGLTGLVASRQASDTVEEGKVISQNPSAKLKVEVGTQVTFTVSTGKAELDVPSLLGLTQSAARSTLVNAGFALGKVTEEYSNEPSGSVIEQSIEYGETATKGTAIDIVLSKGPAPANANGNHNANDANTNNHNGVAPQSEG